jgi:hypothetical protein
MQRERTHAVSNFEDDLIWWHPTIIVLYHTKSSQADFFQISLERSTIIEEQVS